MRYLYSVLFYLALPFLFLRLLWRSRRLPAYRERLGERLGYYPQKLEKCLWVHAVSVGETIAAIPLIKSLQAHYPTWPLLITTMTPTGAARVKAAFGDSVLHAYLPYDTPYAMSRFLDAMQPGIALIMETELWPNLLAACYKRAIPVGLLNARLSQKSAAGYRFIAPLTRNMLQQLTIIAANGQQDAERFIALGAPKDKVVVTGNIKFDLELPADLAEKTMALRATLGEQRFIWIAASTHEGEEEKVLAAHQLLRQQNPDALLILVPRHPDRFAAIAALCNNSFKTIRRSEQTPVTADTAVYLGDTMGELLLLYSVADVTFVGGSLIPRGGHNLLEPGALKKPIITGPHLFNFAEIAALFIAAQALKQVDDAESLAAELLYLMQHRNDCAQMGERALQVVMDNRGALSRQLNLVSQLLA